MPDESSVDKLVRLAWGKPAWLASAAKRKETALIKKGYALQAKDGTKYHLKPSDSLSGSLIVTHAETGKHVGFVVPNNNGSVHSVPEHYNEMQMSIGTHKDIRSAVEHLHGLSTAAESKTSRIPTSSTAKVTRIPNADPSKAATSKISDMSDALAQLKEAQDFTVNPLTVKKPRPIGMTRPGPEKSGPRPIGMNRA
jgi:hypothetical protein